MKKLVVILGATMMGFAASAASISWSFSWATDAGGNNLSAGTTAYLVNAGALSKADATTALKDGSFNPDGKVVDTASIKVNDDNGAFVSQDVTVDLSGAQSFYAIIKTDKYYAMTDIVDATMKAVGPTMVAFGELSALDGTSFMTWDDVGGGATPGPGPSEGGDVPEPTSGVLLMIGGAALALRRKQK